VKYTLHAVAGGVTIRVMLYGVITPERLAVEQAEANRRAYQLGARFPDASPVVWSREDRQDTP
jgi:hypothetical protein